MGCLTAARGVSRFIGSAALAALSLGALSPSAGAAVTLGQVNPPGTPESCSSGYDFVQRAGPVGNSYFVPATVVSGRITSWSHLATNGTEAVTLKVFRPLGGESYLVVGHDGPRSMTVGVTRTFPTAIAVKAGDVLGLAAEQNAFCSIDKGGESVGALAGALADGQSGGPFTIVDPPLLRIAATLEPTNTFTVGRTARNKKKGTATVSATVPNPGTLAVSGKGVKGSSAGANSAVSASGTVRLTIRAKGKKKRKLNHKGKVKIRPTITYTPTSGAASSQTIRLKLKKKR